MRVDLRRRPFLLIASIGLLSAAAVAAGGRLVERIRLGPDDAAAFSRVEAEVRAAFASMSSALERVALAEAAHAERVLLKPAEERDLRPLFERAAQLVGRDPAQPLAVTVYGLDGTPLAWAGRPAELTGAPPGGRPTPNRPPPNRFAGPPALFIAPGPLGTQDLAKIALVERHKGTGGITQGLVSGFVFTAKCAIASTVAHDSHHMIVVGTDEASMAVAGNSLARSGGGQLVVKNGQVIGKVELEIAGLMSTEKADVVAKKAETILKGSKSCGCALNNPNMQLAFLALVVIPELRISDKGLVDVTKFKLIPVLEK